MDYLLISGRKRKRFEEALRRGEPAPEYVRLHQFAWWPPILIRKPYKRWVWGRRYTRWLAWDSELGRYRTGSTELGWR